MAMYDYPSYGWRDVVQSTEDGVLRNFAANLYPKCRFWVMSQHWADDSDLMGHGFEHYTWCLVDRPNSPWTISFQHRFDQFRGYFRSIFAVGGLFRRHDNEGLLPLMFPGLSPTLSVSNTDPLPGPFRLMAGCPLAEPCPLSAYTLCCWKLLPNRPLCPSYVRSTQCLVLLRVLATDAAKVLINILPSVRRLLRPLPQC
jgi:hypothetical protein